MRRTLLLIGAVCGVTAVAGAAPAFDPVAQVQQRFAAVAAFTAYPAPALTLTERSLDDGSASAGRVSLSIASIRAAHSQTELDGLLAVLIVRALPRTGYAPRATGPTLGKIAAAAVAVAAGEAIDPIDEDFPQDRERLRSYSWSPNRSSPEPPSTDRGRAVLALMAKAGSCSGAALAVMNRLAAARDSDAPVRLLAQQTRRDLGVLAAPPDTSCVEG